ncbi:hypothetical protein JL721_5807 [Aureococcus anophagefferens]|nr:hypothetical protein JL721_5807 [Aureococcus anophagefferens]
MSASPRRCAPRDGPVQVRVDDALPHVPSRLPAEEAAEIAQGEQRRRRGGGALAASAAVVVPPGPAPRRSRARGRPPAPVPVATAPVPIAPRVAVVEPEPGAYVEDALPFRAEGPHVGARLRRSVRTPARSLWVEGFVVGYLGAGESDFFDALGQPAPLYRVRYDGGLLALRGDEEDLEEHELLPSLAPATLPPGDPRPAAAPAFAYDDDGVNSAEVGRPPRKRRREEQAQGAKQGPSARRGARDPVP